MCVCFRLNVDVNIQEGLTPSHLKKAKLMFFYTRYPSSNVLKTFFPDVKVRLRCFCPTSRTLPLVSTCASVRVGQKHQQCVGGERQKGRGFKSQSH